MRVDWVTALQGLFLAGCLAGIIYHLLGILAAGRFHRQRQERPDPWSPPVSILKPVRGADPHAFANFLSFCRQDYPEYEVLFGIQDPEDPAIPIIQELRRACPDVPIHLVIDPSRIGSNLKVCNLHNLMRHARHDVLVIADSDMRVGPQFLSRVVPLLAPSQADRVGLVTCPYNGVSLRTLPAALEALSISTVFLPGVFFAADFGKVDFAFGASIALRRQVLDEMGGFRAIVNHLADDFQLGNRAASLGYRVVVSTYVVDSVTPNLGFWPMFTRLLRWSRTVRICRPRGYLAGLITHSTLFGLTYLLATQLSPAGWLVFGSQQFFRWLAAWQVSVRVLGNRELRRWFWLLPASDLFNLGLWIGSWLGNRVSWRGVRFRLVEGGRMVPLDPVPTASEEERRPVAGIGSSSSR